MSSKPTPRLQWVAIGILALVVAWLVLDRFRVFAAEPRPVADLPEWAAYGDYCFKVEFWTPPDSEVSCPTDGKPVPADDPKLRGEFHRFLRGTAGGFSRSKVGGDWAKPDSGDTNAENGWTYNISLRPIDNRCDLSVLRDFEKKLVGRLKGRCNPQGPTAGYSQDTPFFNVFRVMRPDEYFDD